MLLLASRNMLFNFYKIVTVAPGSTGDTARTTAGNLGGDAGQLSAALASEKLGRCVCMGVKYFDTCHLLLVSSVI